MIPSPLIRTIVEWLIAATFAFLLFLFLRNFVFRIADVSGISMEPTLSNNDMVLLTRVGYWFNDPVPGDIIAFPYQENPSEHFIKRVFGVPGDVIDFDFELARFTINGEVPDFDIGTTHIFDAGDIEYPYTVPDGHFFVLGDNRNMSKDSRFQSVGSIPKEDIVGKVVLRFWPFASFGGVE